MRKGCVAFLSLTLMAVTLASCGRFQREQRAAWRDEAEAQCLSRKEVSPSAYVALRDTPITGPGTCGMNRPLRVKAFLAGGVGVSSTQTLACPIVATTDRFLDAVVQPAAMAVMGAQVIELRAGSYSCRAMNNGSGTTRRSEHAFGNALDIFAFRLADGREVTVKGGWNGTPEEQAFLREVFVGACAHYRTVLGPGADMFHYDHFHVDLARHASGRSICKPVLKFTPRRDLAPPDSTLRSAQWQPVPGRPPSPFAPPLSAHAALRPAKPMPAPSASEAGPRRSLRAAADDLPSVGPIRLPGAVQGNEEIVIGDVEGEMIDPDTDPFAAETAPRRGNLAVPATAAAQTSPAGLRPAMTLPRSASPARDWPPRF